MIPRASFPLGYHTGADTESIFTSLKRPSGGDQISAARPVHEFHGCCKRYARGPTIVIHVKAIQNGTGAKAELGYCKNIIPTASQDLVHSRSPQPLPAAAASARVDPREDAVG